MCVYSHITVILCAENTTVSILLSTLTFCMQSLYIVFSQITLSYRENSRDLTQMSTANTADTVTDSIHLRFFY